MKWVYMIIMTLVCISCSSGHFTSPEKILFDKVVAASKYNDGNGLSEDEYDQISDYIAQGKTRWIALYPTLKRAPFLGITSLQEGVDIAMAYALPENPNAVLNFVNDENVNYICGVPFIEPDINEINSYFHRTRKALSELKSATPWKEKCMLNLRRAFPDNSSSVRP